MVAKSAREFASPRVRQSASPPVVATGRMISSADRSLAAKVRSASKFTIGFKIVVGFKIRKYNRLQILQQKNPIEARLASVGFSVWSRISKVQSASKFETPVGFKIYNQQV